jgi:hypothetical protein
MPDNHQPKMLTKEERVGLREHYASRDDVADVEASSTTPTPPTRRSRS